MPRVLILEDEKVVARDLQGILGTLGYQTVLAASGEEAIAAAKKDSLDLALVDINLAGALDGIETAQVLREQLDLGVVYLTAHGDDQTLERAKPTEPLGYLVKPFAEPTLRATLQMAVHKAGVERRDRIQHRWRTTVLDQLTVGLITTDPTGSIKMINARGQSLTGWAEREALGKNLAEVLSLHRADKSPIAADLLECARQGKAAASEEEPPSLVSKSGEEVEVEYRISPIQDEHQQTLGMSLVFWPAGKAEPESAPQTAPIRETEWDAVTGLPGRAQAKATLQASQKAHSKLFAALFVLDRYYFTARKYGTATADEVLTYYCTFLAQEVQATPYCLGLFRWTGPCFLAVFGPWDNASIAQREIARCTRAKLVEEFQASSHVVLLPVSASVEVFPVCGISLDKLINQIDSYVALRTKGEEF